MRMMYMLYILASGVMAFRWLIGRVPIIGMDYDD